MRTNYLLAVLAGIAGLALGFGMGYAMRPATEVVSAAPATTTARDDEVAALLLTERQLRDELSAARRRLARLEQPDPVDPVAMPVEPGADDDEPERDPAEVKAEALRDLENLEYQLTGDPTNPDLLARMVRAAARAGEHDRAIATLTELAEKYPENADIQSQLGRAFIHKIPTIEVQMEQGRMAFAAVARFDRALEIDPEHFGARLNRAVSNYYMPEFLNKTEASIRDLEKLVEQGGGRGDDDRYAHAYAWLSRAYEKAGRAEDAKKTLEVGLRLFPADPNLLRVSSPR